MSRFSKLTPILALATAVALLLAGVALAFWNERAYTAQKVAETTVQARILAATVTAALVFNDRGAAREYVNALNVNAEVLSAGIYDTAGALFAGYSRAAEQPPPATIASGAAPLDSNRLAVTSPVRQDGATVGTVYLETATEPLQRRLTRYGIIALLVTMASLVVAVLGVAQKALSTANTELTRRAGDLAGANASLHAEIEEREKAQEALRRAQRMEAVGQLTAGIAHDFNNLLTAVIGNLDLLARRESADDRARRMIASAQKAAQRGAQLTTQLLAFSRRQHLAPEPVDLNRIVANMEGMLRSTLGATIAIETKADAVLPAAFADPSQVELMLLNLAINARDAMPDGGRLTIATGTVLLGEPTRPEEPPPGDYVTVSVSDTGTGIEPGVIDRIFEPFFTTKGVGKGSGLGLSQVLGVAQQLGGGVRIETRPGEGTTVRICLPRAAANAPVAEAETTQHPATGEAGQGRVLLVDDDDDVRSVAAAMLADAGHEVVEAADGGAALQILGHDGARIGVMVADFAMPGMNGVEVARAAQRIQPGLPVLFVTGYADSAVLAAHAAPDAVLQKPFRASDLLARIALALAASAASAAGRKA